MTEQGHVVAEQQLMLPNDWLAGIDGGMSDEALPDPSLRFSLTRTDGILAITNSNGMRVEACSEPWVTCLAVQLIIFMAGPSISNNVGFWICGLNTLLPAAHLDACFVAYKEEEAYRQGLLALAQVDCTTGALRAWEVDGTPLLAECMAPSFFRAPSDNDRGGSGGTSYLSRCAVMVLHVEAAELVHQAYSGGTYCFPKKAHKGSNFLTYLWLIPSTHLGCSAKLVCVAWKKKNLFLLFFTGHQG